MEGFMRAYADRLIETWAKDVQSFEVESTKFIYNIINNFFKNQLLVGGQRTDLRGLLVTRIKSHAVLRVK
jgi:hypothetical protein